MKTNEPIYKFGKTTKQHLTRFHQYPKGSVLLFQMICDDCDFMENQIKDYFKDCFTQRTDIGTEYFEGNYKEMIHVIYSIIQNDEFIDKTLSKKLNWNKYMKEYYHNHSDSILEYKKQQYQKKKDVLNEKIECDCGKIYTRQHQKRHEKTKKHQDWENKE